MPETAFTIGNHIGYDRDLLSPDVVAGERVVNKMGRHPEWDEPYGGGWIWRTREAAQAFIDNTELSFPAKVYGVKLAGGWEHDVSPEPDPEDGVHRLLVDSELFILEHP